MTALDPGSAIVLDDLPRFERGGQLSQRLIQIASAIGTRNQKLITLSHHSIPSDIVASLADGRFFETTSPPMTANDAGDIFEQHGGTRDAIATPALESFVLSTSGNPTLLAAVARAIQAEGWQHAEEHRVKCAEIASTGEIAQETMFRLLNSVEREESRELLYRLCLVTADFGLTEVRCVSSVIPEVEKPQERYNSLQGLWIERQGNDIWVVCPLVRAVGVLELDATVMQSALVALSDLLFEPGSISPIDFAKAVGYLRRAKCDTRLGLHLLHALESVHELPRAWQTLVYQTTTISGLLSECPTPIAVLIKAEQIKVAHALGNAAREHVAEAEHLFSLLKPDEIWAISAYSANVAPLVAKDDFGAGIRLCRLLVDNFETLIRFVKDDLRDLDVRLWAEVEFMCPWFIVSEVKSADDFGEWFDFIRHQPPERAKRILSADLAAQGLSLVLDRLWMVQHELPKTERNFEPALEAYETVIEYSKKLKLPLVHVLAVRSQIVVHAEYLNDLSGATRLAEEFLAEVHHDDEVIFLIREVIGRQYAYKQKYELAVKNLSKACSIDTGTFDNLRCRAFIELSQVTGETDTGQALEYSKQAVKVARRNPRNVTELDMVASLGELAIAAWFAGDRQLAFDSIDEAFIRLPEVRDESIEYKTIVVILSHALGYMATMAAIGKPPDENFTVPQRGRLIGHNKLAAGLYDERNYKSLDMSPTLLVMFANATDRTDRAEFWANKGIDDARASGLLACVSPLSEALISTLIAKGRTDAALDYAFESAIASTAMMVLYRTGRIDVQKRQDALLIMGGKPSSDWSFAERRYMFTGVLPAALAACVGDNPRASLLSLAEQCSEMANGASGPRQFLSVSESIEGFIDGCSSVELHKKGTDADGDENGPIRAINYLLSSFAADATLRLSIIQHALILHRCSSEVSADSGIWKLLTEEFVKSWQRRFERSRFQFSAPAVIQQDLKDLDTIPAPERAKSLIRIILTGLSISLPAEIQSTADWLRN